MKPSAPGFRATVAAVGVVALLGMAAPAAASVPTATADEPEWASADDIGAYVAAQREAMRLPGLVVVVVADGETLYEGAFGDTAPGGPPMTLDTPFALGSTSKQFTGLVIQQLVADGRLSLDDTVAELLPDLIPPDGSPYDDVTVEQLLSHRSGHSYPSGSRQWRLWLDDASIQDHVRTTLREAPIAAPGEMFSYTNATYNVLGAIVEQVTGQPYPSALEELVTEPLGLGSTTADLARAEENGLAADHYPWYGFLTAVTPQPHYAVSAPSAFVTSSGNDLRRLLEAHLGLIDTDMPESTLAEAREAIDAETEYADYASGWTIRPFWELRDLDEDWDDGTLPDLWEHSGATLRSFTYLAMEPESGLGVVLLTNVSPGMDDARSVRLFYGLMHAIAGTAPQPAQVNPLIAMAPALTIGVPLLLVGAIVWLVLVVRRPPRSRVGRWAPVVVGSVVVIASLFLAVVVVPSQTGGPLLDTWWWAGVPDLAVSTALMLLLSAVVVGLIVAVIVRSSRHRSAGRADAGTSGTSRASASV